MRWRWIVAGIATVLATTPLALPLWDGGLSDTLGRFVTVEQIHLLEYGALGLLAGLSLRRDPRPWRTRSLLAALLALVGLADELLQGLLPKRFFAWSDVFLNVLGALSGLLLARALACLRRPCVLLRNGQDRS